MGPQSGEKDPPAGPAGVPSEVARFFEEEEAALARGQARGRALVVPTPGFLSYGVGVPGSAPWIDTARRTGLAVVRRRTGGTGLLHAAGDLLWSVVLPRSDPRVGRDFVRAYERFGSPVARVLGARGVHATWEGPPGLSEAYCTLGDRGKVLTAHGRILGGAAQHATRDALLHHGTISWEVDRKLLAATFGGSMDGPVRRLGGLRELLPNSTPADLARGLGDELERFARSPPDPRDR